MSRNGAIVAAVVMVLATPVAAFWLLGDQSIDRDPEDLDHMVRLQVSTDAIRVAGIIALAAWVIAAIVILARYGARPPADAARLVSSLVVAGSMVAGIGRTVTAGTIGANIGGGLAVLAGPPILLAVIGYGVWPYVRTRVRRSGRGSISRASGRR